MYNIKYYGGCSSTAEHFAVAEGVAGSNPVSHPFFYSMKIICAKNIGFCSGVKRAILIAEKSIKTDKKPVQFLGSIVHNEKVNEEFRKRGIKFINDLEKAKPGTVIIRAHGIPPLPQNISEKITLRDATCPLVKRSQLIAKDLFKNGYQMIIIGDKNHSETKGIKGYTNNTAIIVENEKQIRNLPKFNKIGVIAQTTQSSENVNKILKELKKKTERIKYINTLCPEVINRQKELNVIIKRSEGVLILGSRLSANTKRLTQIAKKYGKRFFWVNSLEELKKLNLKRFRSLGIVSGTSTPNWEIDKIKKWLEKKQK